VLDQRAGRLLEGVPVAPQHEVGAHLGYLDEPLGLVVDQVERVRADRAEVLERGPEKTSPAASPIVTCPSSSLIPKLVTIWRASLVAAWRSSLAPVDSSPKASPSGRGAMRHAKLTSASASGTVEDPP
jgi:hypothetical protein